jgi:phage tail-like protein
MLDVNGTRYHLVFGPQDWPMDQRDRKWEYDANHHWVQLQTEPYQFTEVGPHQKVLSRRGSARDAYGHWYWISEDGKKIMAQWAGAKQAVELYPHLAGRRQPAEPRGDFQPIPSDAAIQPKTLSGLAVLADGYLVAGIPELDADNESSRSGLLVIDLYALDGGPLLVPLPHVTSPTPPGQVVEATERFDLAPLSQGGLLVLDRPHKRVWRLGATLESLPIEAGSPGELTTFQPSEGPERRAFSQTISQPVSLSSETYNPVAITALPDGSFWILDRVPPDGDPKHASVLWFYSQPHNFECLRHELITDNLIEPGDDPLKIRYLQGYDLAYLPAPANQDATLPKGQPKGQLLVVDPSGKQVYGIDVVTLPDPATPWSDIERHFATARDDYLKLRLQRSNYYPLRYFAGIDLIEDKPSSQVYYLQSSQGTRWLCLQALPRQKYEPKADIELPPPAKDGESIPLAFDGRDPGCVWHRLCVDAQIPPDTQIQVATRAADIHQDLQYQPWQTQPSLYHRPLGSEVPFSNLWNQEELADPHTGTWELLFQKTQGRFLQLRLTLLGNGLASPKVRAVRLHYPRFSYLKAYLPAVYQQERVSMQFLENFLANPEGLFTTMEGMIAQMQYLMDVRTAPEDALDWLAGWLGLLLQPAWSEYQRRLLIAHTPYFFRRRGTLSGVMQAALLTVYPELGPEIFQDRITRQNLAVRVVEHFLTRTQAGVALGNPSEQTVSTSGNVQEDARVRAHRFTVMVPEEVSSETLGLVKRIVELEKPAHTAFAVKLYWKAFRVGEVRLGLDTVLGPGSRIETFRLGKTALAEGALEEPFPYNLTNRFVVAQ